MSLSISEQVKRLPAQPGIYKFYDKQDRLLYIGKAMNLYNRVSSYFKDSHSDRPHIIPMIPQISKIEFVVTDNDVESLILEALLIKKHLPPFNIDLKDDKSYAWLYINTRDDFPTVKIVRTLNKDQYNRGRLFGPYPKGSAVYSVFRYLRKLYPFCTQKNPKGLCFYYHIGLCPGSCGGIISKENYRENIDGIIKFLEGKKKRELSGMEKKMREYAAELNFEKAAVLRDKIENLRYLGQEINFKRGDSAGDYIDRRADSLKDQLKDIALQVGLESIRRIECYDISNLQGLYAYGSMTVAIDGILKSTHYRIFKIKEMSTPDDPEMIKEVITRRLKHLSRDVPDADESLSDRPDILLIDGAITQLNAIKQFIPKDITLMGISKGKHIKRHGGRKKDEFWIVRGGIVFKVEITQPSILIGLRDEAHRFALRHNRQSRKFAAKRSILDEVEGIGLKRKKLLIKTFGSIEGIKNASFESINAILKNKAVTDRLIRLIPKSHES